MAHDSQCIAERTEAKVTIQGGRVLKVEFYIFGLLVLSILIGRYLFVESEVYLYASLLWSIVCLGLFLRYKIALFTAWTFNIILALYIIHWGVMDIANGGWLYVGLYSPFIVFSISSTAFYLFNKPLSQHIWMVEHNDEK